MSLRVLAILLVMLSMPALAKPPAKGAAGHPPKTEAVTDAPEAAAAATTSAATETADIPPETEKKLQADLLEQQFLEHGLIRSTAIEKYLEGLLSRIQAASSQPPRFAHVRLRFDEGYNAYSTPVGNIILTPRWIKSASSEGELIALLAHEYGHLLLGHRDQQVISNQMVSGGIKVMQVLRGKMGTDVGVAMGLGLVNETWNNMLATSWGRQQELDADRFAFDTCQTLKITFASCAKAFVTTLHSYEQPANAPVAGTAPGAAGAPSAPAAPGAPGINSAGKAPAVNLAADHPSAAERMQLLQAMFESAPRVPRAAGNAGKSLKTLQGSSEFKLIMTQLQLCDQMSQASDQGKVIDFVRAAQKLEATGEPVAAQPALIGAFWHQIKMGQPDRMFRGLPEIRDPARWTSDLNRIMQREDVHGIAFSVQAQFDLSNGDNEALTKTLDTAVERFDDPDGLLPLRLSIYKAWDLRDNQLAAQGKLSFWQNLTQAGHAAIRLKLFTRCSLNDQWKEECLVANTTPQELEKVRQNQAAMQKAAEDRMSKKIDKALGIHP